MITQAQKDALRWLVERGGDGCFDRNGILLAMGESAPVVRTTWNRLRELALVETYNPNNKGRGRLRVTEAGRSVAA